MAKTPLSTIAQFAPCNILIRGNVVFSRVASRIEGEELVAQNQVAKSKGRPEHAKPYITITIKNPVIVDDGTLPAQVKSVIQERFYTKQDGTVIYTQESKSPFLPEIAYGAEAGELRGQGIANRNVPMQAEFAQGMDVTLGVNLYKSGMYPGLGLNFILVNEPIRYFSGSAIATALGSQGVSYVPTAQTSAPAVEPYNAPQPTQQFTQQIAPQVESFNQTYAEQPQVNNFAPQNQFAQNVSAPVSYATNQQFGDNDIPFNNVSAPNPYGMQPQVQRPVRNN